MVRFFNVYHPKRTFALVCSEASLIAISYMASIFLHWGSQSYRVIQRPEVAGELALASTIWVLCLHNFDLYNLQRITNRRETIIGLLKALSTASIILGVILYFFPSLHVVRGVLIPATLIVLWFLLLVRFLFMRWGNFPMRRKRVALVGTGELAARLAHEIRGHPEIAIDLVGYLDDLCHSESRALPVQCIGSVDEIEGVVEKNKINTLIIAVHNPRGHLPIDALLKLRVQGVKVEYAHTVYEQITGKIAVELLLPSWLIFSDGFQIHSFFLAIQRAYSFVIALTALAVSLPIIFLAALIIRFESNGPIFYRQDRVGFNGVTFALFKLRSMRQDAERETGAVWSWKNDHRVTRVGRVLRRYRIDELPQLWNVILGDMNLVGPRPERPLFVELLKAKMPYYEQRHVVRPGLTGWTQVRCRYGSSVEDHCERLCYDYFYIKNISASLDLYILLLTIKDVLHGRGI